MVPIFDQRDQTAGEAFSGKDIVLPGVQRIEDGPYGFSPRIVVGHLPATGICHGMTLQRPSHCRLDCRLRFISLHVGLGIPVWSDSGEVLGHQQRVCGCLFVRHQQLPLHVERGLRIGDMDFDVHRDDSGENASHSRTFPSCAGNIAPGCCPAIPSWWPSEIAPLSSNSVSAVAAVWLSAKD
jgi:hypothetical protein